MIVTHPHLRHVAGGGLAIRKPEKDRFRACHEKRRSRTRPKGPGGAGASKTIGRAKLAVANFEPAIDPLRGFNAAERRVVALPSGGKNLAESSATLSTSYKTAANIVPAAKLKLHLLLTPLLTLAELSNRTECRDAAQPRPPTAPSGILARSTLLCRPLYFPRPRHH
jgi:hypothetical protein